MLEEVVKLPLALVWLPPKMIIRHMSAELAMRVR